MSLNRVERRRLETHERLIESLRDELAETGLEATTVQAVTDRADVALGTFYNHFEDKDAAIRALAAIELGRLRSACSAMPGRNEQLPRMLSTTVAVMVNRALVDEPWIRCLHALAVGGYWPGDAGHGRHVALAAEAQARTAIGAGDLAWTASVMSSLLTTLVATLAATLDIAVAGKIIADALRSLLGALGVPADLIVEEVNYATSLSTDSAWTDDIVLAATDEH